MTAAPAPSTTTGILWFLGAIIAFALMDALIKWLSADYATWQIVFFRAAFALVPLALLVARSGGVAVLRTRRLPSHLMRATVGVAAVFCFFYAFAHLPLADVYAIHFASPLIITALSVPLLKEPVGWRRWTAVLVGFVGVLLVLRPGLSAGVDAGLPALVCLAGALFYSLSIIQLRHLARTETTAATVFWFMLVLTAVGTVMMLPDWRMPGPADFLLLATIGVIGGVAQLMITQAFRLAPPSLLAPFEYTGMIWAVMLGWFVFGELPDPSLWLGGAIVIASGLYVFHREARRAGENR